MIKTAEELAPGDVLLSAHDSRTDQFVAYLVTPPPMIKYTSYGKRGGQPRVNLHFTEYARDIVRPDRKFEVQTPPGDV